MTKAEIKAEKAAQKAKLAGEKLDKTMSDRAIKVKEPLADPLQSINDLHAVTSVVPKNDAELNILGSKTKSLMNSIIKSADSTLNTNPDNIQNAICSIIRQSLQAYHIHVGRLFDTDLG